MPMTCSNAPARAPRKSHKLWTPANIVTFLRICLVPVFVAAFLTNWPTWLGLEFISEQMKGLIAAALFILISCTDWIDGYLARSRNEVTDFGKFLDPLADKILVAAALIALVELQILPSWPVLIILAREFIVSGVRMIAAANGEVIAASWYGKFKTVFQIVAIVLFIVKYSVAYDSLGDALESPLFLLSWAVMLIALALTVFSMFDYLSKARHLIGFKRKGGDVGLPRASEVASRVSETAQALVEAMSAEGSTLATAESLTGGMASAALTEVPGSSQVLKGGVVSYTNEVKSGVLGVDEEVLASEGAVSEAAALQMACGARERLNATYGLAMTGIAGPAGEEPGKPIGTVWIAVAGPKGSFGRSFRFDGDRELVRLQTVATALSLLQEELGTPS